MSRQILHVINTHKAEMGGGGEHLLHLTRGLAQYGFQSTVALGSDGPIASQLREVALPVIVLGPMGATTPLRLAALFSTMRPDIVHLHGTRAGLLGTIAARRSHTRPVIYTAHALSFHRRLPPGLQWGLARLEAVTCASADGIICLSRGDVEAARRRGIPMARSVVVPNGIDGARFARTEDCRREFGLAPQTPVVGMVARLVSQKDPLAFVQLARRISAREPNVRFLLIGDGPLRPDVERAVHAAQLDGRFVVTGFRRDIPALLHTMDVVVLTSRWEGLPFALLEAMAAGRPVVATRLPGTVEVVVDGVTGHLISLDDERRFVDAVTELLQDPQRRAEMGRQAQARVRQEFSLSRMVDATAGVYASVLAETRATSPA